MKENASGQAPKLTLPPPHCWTVCQSAISMHVECVFKNAHFICESIRIVTYSYALITLCEGQCINLCFCVQRENNGTFNKYCLLKQWPRTTITSPRGGMDVVLEKGKTSKNPHSKRLRQNATNIVINVKCLPKDIAYKE